jgi:hypothetical protein
MHITTNTTNTTNNLWVCQEHITLYHPVAYQLWYITMFLLFTGTLIAGTAGLYLRRCHPQYMPIKKAKSQQSISFARSLIIDSVKPLNSFGVIYFSICRLLWLLNPHAVSVSIAGKLYANPDKNQPARPIISILLYTPQVIALLSLTILVTLWRRVTNNAQKIRRQAKSVRTETKIVLLGSFYLTFLALPIAFVSSWIDSLSLVSNALFGLYVIALGSMSFFYICRLNKIAKSLTSKRSKQAVVNIERTVQALVFSCSMLVIAIFYNTLFVDRCQLSSSSDMNSRFLIYIWLVHLGEAIGISAIAFAVLPSKHAAKRPTPRASQMSKSEYEGEMTRKSNLMQSTAEDLEADIVCDSSVNDSSVAVAVAVAGPTLSMDEAPAEISSEYVTGPASMESSSPVVGESK